MSTLTPEEIEALAAAHTDEHYGDDCIFYETDFVGFATALEAELRKRWFAEPVAAIGAGWLLMYAGHEPLSTIVERHGLRIDDALYAAPQEESC